MHVLGAGMASPDNVESPSALTELQKRFCLIDLGGEIRVVDRKQVKRVLKGKEDSDVAFYKRQDGVLLMKRRLESLPISCKPKDVIDDFLVHPDTHIYNKIAFNPQKQPDTTLNYWCGNTAAPSPGECKSIGQYLLKVICNGDKDVCNYLLKYLAHMIQRPQEKPGIMLVLLGGQGTGKGVFFQLLRAIWGRTTLQVSDIDQVIGRFNAALERNYLICMDEALFSGDRRSLDRLKSLITEPWIQVEQKYQPSRSMESVHRFFAASNHDHFAHIERDDRRFLFLRLSNKRQRDTSYFSQLCKAIEDPTVVGAFVDYLLELNISNFNVRDRPETHEHAQQKLLSLDGFDRYWFEVLTTGDFNAGRINIDKWVESVFIPTSRLVDKYRDFDRNAERHRTIQESHVSTAIRRLCPSAKPKRKMYQQHGVGPKQQKRGFQLPDIKQARSDFEAYVGCQIEWDDGDAAERAA